MLCRCCSLRPEDVELLSPPLLHFFEKRLVCPRSGLPVLAAACVDDAALREAARRVERLTACLPAAAQRLLRLGCSVQIIGKTQQCSNLPQYAHLSGEAAGAFDARGRGYGGLLPCGGEENLLRLPCDRYKDHRDILSHEFAHCLLDWGFPPSLTSALKAELDACRVAACAAGRWEGAYAATCADEYWAELVMWHIGSRGDFGRIARPRAGRAWLRSHDPAGAALVAAILEGSHPLIRDGGGAGEELSVLALEQAAMVSVDGDGAPCQVLVVNGDARSAQLSWVDAQGGLHAYAVVPPGGCAGQSTYVGHVWELSAAAEETAVLGRFAAVSGLGVVHLGPDRSATACSTSKSPMPGDGS